jgi:hypothetical protein
MKKTLVIHGDAKPGDAKTLAKHFGMRRVFVRSMPQRTYRAPILVLTQHRWDAAALAKRFNEMNFPSRTLNLASALRQASRGAG